MSEFKYACPVCGQHIQCDSSQTGTVMDCPTCFQQITVPQAPAGADQKLLLAGSKAGERKTSLLAARTHPKISQPAKSFTAAVTFILALVLAAWAGVHFFGGSLISAHGNWQAADIGAVGAAGAISQEGETLTLAGSGADIWSQRDACHFVSRAASGDVSLTAHVLQVQNTDPWAKAGLMVRESLAPDSAHVMICVTPNNGVAFQQRSTTGVQATSLPGVPHVRAPYWVRLTRRGDVFTADSSADGQTWVPTGSTTLAMKPGVYAGLAVTSHKAGTLCHASFDQVTVNGAGVRNFPANSTTN
jgi:regulation of enolase protein 1 (concanavalin A-like superfamily)/DNA-directed RNA polymerase subunit RPC12/RpoP